MQHWYDHSLWIVNWDVVQILSVKKFTLKSVLQKSAITCSFIYKESIYKELGSDFFVCFLNVNILKPKNTKHFFFQIRF